LKRSYIVYHPSTVRNEHVFRTALVGAHLAALLATTAARGEDVPAPGPKAVEAPASPPSDPTGLGFAPFAAVGYADETGLLFGAAAIAFYHHPEAARRRDSQVLLAGAVSLREQFTAVLGPDLYLAEDRVHLAASVSAARFPDRFFGIESRERLRREEPYTPVYVETEVSPKLRLSARHYMYLGPALRFQHASIVERQPGGLIDAAAVPGARGGSTFQVGFRGFWDARDSTLYPTRGALVDVSWLGASRAAGSDYTFSRARLDARAYVPSFWSRHVLALEGLVEGRVGEAPFYDLGKLGGSRLLRGHFDGKHRDRQLAAAQIEYRFPVVWRFGAVAFASAGTVASTLADLASAKVYASAGGGVRFAPSAKAPVNVRLDVAYGDEPRFYLDVGEAF